MTLVAADGAAAFELFSGGVVVVRAAEYLAAGRATLTVTVPDAQATSGKSVSDAQTQPDLATAHDTLTIPFVDLPLTFGLDYRIHVFYRNTGTGADDGEQHFTQRRVYMWGFENVFGGMRVRTDGGGDTDAIEQAVLSRDRPWFGVFEMEGLAFSVATSHALELSAFKLAGSGAVLVDQVVFIPNQDIFVAAPRIYNDFQGGGSSPSPWPDHVVRAHDETDAHQGDSVASYYQAADGESAEVMQADWASFNADFILDARYDAYALACVHILESETLVEDHFSRNVYDGWGTPDTGGEWDISGANIGFAFVGPSGSAAIPRGDWNALTTYLVNNLVRGSDGNGYISKAGGNLGHDPVLDVTFTFWDPLTGGDTGIFGGTFPGGGSASTPVSYDDARITARMSSSIVVADAGIGPGNQTWYPFGLGLRGSGYQALAKNDPSGNMTLIVRTGPFEIVLGGPIPIATPYIANDEYWMTFEIVGTTLRAKMWKDGDAEPDWQIDVVDNGMNQPDQAGFNYLYGQASCIARLNYGNDGGTVVNGWTRFDEVVVDRIGEAAQAAHIGLTRTGTGELRAQDTVAANRNWAWRYLGDAGVVWPSPGVAGLDVVAWNPESASEWQRVGAQAFYWTHRPSAIMPELEFRAERQP